jgi:TolB-like protein
MPFRDLSGKKASVGEAIRETVTADLREAGGVTVVERAQIDRVLGEQALQARRADLDPLSSVRVGKLLGASLIVTGAYQEEASTVRLTARFVRVETGEIVGTAKVDGPAGDLLRLQDSVTAQLMRSAGIDAARVVGLGERVAASSCARPSTPSRS